MLLRAANDRDRSFQLGTAFLLLLDALSARAQMVDSLEDLISLCKISAGHWCQHAISVFFDLSPCLASVLHMHALQLQCVAAVMQPNFTLGSSWGNAVVVNKRM